MLGGGGVQGQSRTKLRSKRDLVCEGGGRTTGPGKGGKINDGKRVQGDRKIKTCGRGGEPTKSI